MTKESELLDIDIAKTKAEISDTSIGISLLGTFFLGVIPLFYGIMGIYKFTFQDIQWLLITVITIIFTATILSILQWEQNTQKLKGLYIKKTDMINNTYKKEATTLNKTKKKKN